MSHGPHLLLRLHRPRCVCLGLPLCLSLGLSPRLTHLPGLRRQLLGCRLLYLPLQHLGPPSNRLVFSCWFPTFFFLVFLPCLSSVIWSCPPTVASVQLSVIYIHCSLSPSLNRHPFPSCIWLGSLLHLSCASTLALLTASIVSFVSVPSLLFCSLVSLYLFFFFLSYRLCYVSRILVCRPPIGCLLAELVCAFLPSHSS